MDAIESNPQLAIPFDAPIKFRNRETYASFGEDGLTATANAHGHLIQITRYFGNEPSGFICVDLPGTPEPYRVTERTKELQRSCEDTHKGMKLQISEQLDNKNQKLDNLKWGTGRGIPKIHFYHDRWPCFITRNPWFDFEIQYFISGKIVYQTYTFSFVKGMGYVFLKKFPPLMISANLLLRHLDFVTENSVSSWNTQSHQQNDAKDDYVHGASANAKTIFIKHKNCETGQQGKKDAILFISPYIDNRAQSVSRVRQSFNYEIQLDNQAQTNLLKNQRMQITLSYTLELTSSATEMNTPISENTLHPLHPKDFAYKPPLFVDDKHLVRDQTKDHE